MMNEKYWEYIKELRMEGISMEKAIIKAHKMMLEEV
jgi:hypothetical protein